MRNKTIVCVIILVLIAALQACAKPAELSKPSVPFDLINDYREWASTIGYPSGELTDDGTPGLMEDRFYTLPDSPGYASGRIVIGDSRCCQLGIYAQRAGLDGFATFAVWAGHYADRRPPIPTEEFYKAVADCFREQIRTAGKCEIFFFATVNDYDHTGNANDGNIAAAIGCAERLARMKCERGGKELSPSIVIIGIEGAGEGEGAWLEPASFNRFIDDYNNALRKAAEQSTVIDGASLQRFTTVRALTNGKADFVDDGLHYGDKTLEILVRFIMGGR